MPERGRATLAALKDFYRLCCSCRSEARSDTIAAAHHGMWLLGRCLSAWRRLWRAHARAIAHHDEDRAAAATTHHRHHVLRTAIAVWHRQVHEHCLPKVCAAQPG